MKLSEVLRWLWANEELRLVFSSVVALTAAFIVVAGKKYVTDTYGTDVPWETSLTLDILGMTAVALSLWGLVRVCVRQYVAMRVDDLAPLRGKLSFLRRPRPTKKADDTRQQVEP